MAKRNTRTQTKGKGKPLKRGFPWFLWLTIGLVIIAVTSFVLVRTLTPGKQVIPPNSGELKAAIVDQLYSLQPNPGFVDRTTQNLKDYGFTAVDVYRGDVVTVEFYRELANYGYKLIIFRVHSGLLRSERGIGSTVWLFTSEPYKRTRYVMCQLRDQVTAARVSEDAPAIFAVGSRFIAGNMEAKFNNTAIIVMGCASFNSDELAQAFIQNGASVYMGWDVSVGLNYVDGAAGFLVEKLCSEELTIGEAVAETMRQKGPDPNNNAVLKYYPSASANKTLRQLIE